jgi:hypothetical protein
LPAWHNLIILLQIQRLETFDPIALARARAKVLSLSELRLFRRATHLDASMV